MKDLNTGAQKFTIPTPPKEVFSVGSNPTRDAVNSGATTFLLDRIEYPKEGGMLVYVMGATYPKKGFPFPEAVVAFNQAKRLFITLMKVGNPFLLLFRKESFLRSYLWLIDDICRPYNVKIEYMTPTAKSLQCLIFEFLSRIGIPGIIAGDFAIILSNCIQYDDAYRYRIQDICSETTKEKLIQNPHKEIKRLMAIHAKREYTMPIVSEKFERLTFLLSLALFIPKYKKAFREAIVISDWSDMQYDEADRYWVSLRDDYLFIGQTYEERSKDIVKPTGYKVAI